MIITIFILTLIQVNGQLDSRPELIPELTFKTIIIIIFIVMFIGVNDHPDP